MKHFIIDGNNLIGKIESLKRLHKKDNQQSRVKLAFMLESYFSKKKAYVELFFDGFEKEKIKISGIKMFYSDASTADDLIRKRIEKSTNPKNLNVITSDRSLSEFAKVCGSRVISSEEYAQQITSHPEIDEEKLKIDELKNSDEFKKLFGIN